MTTLYQFRQYTIEALLQDATCTNESAMFAVFTRGTEAINKIQAEFRKQRESGRVYKPDVGVIEKCFVHLVDCASIISHIFEVDMPLWEDLQSYILDELEPTVVTDGILASMAASMSLNAAISEFYITEAGERDLDIDYAYDWVKELLAMAFVVADIGGFDTSEIINED